MTTYRPAYHESAWACIERAIEAGPTQAATRAARRYWRVARRHDQKGWNVTRRVQPHRRAGQWGW